MGINIAALLPKTELKIDDLKGKKIAIDAFNALYQFLSSIRQPDGTPLMDSEGKITSHLQGLLSRTTNLMSQGIQLAYVFDGIPPKLKLKEQQERRQHKEEADINYHTATEDEDVDAMAKYARQSSRLTQEMIYESKELLHALGLPVIEAPSEAEAQAAFMCARNDVWATASQDADALLFGTPRLLRNLTLSQKRKLPGGRYVITFLELIELSHVLRALQLTHDQLIVLGILVGSDFNIGGIKGIGPKKAIKLLTEEPDFDTIFKKLNAPFDWKEIYDIFKHIPTTRDYTLQWKPIDEEKINEILVEQHQFSKERVQNTLEKIKILQKEKTQKGLSDFT